ncbi:MAG: hypothetical protein KF774_12420 [Planctomyces sp.]|nr:hypothetical protein [Planctomyces sp.]
MTTPPPWRLAAALVLASAAAAALLATPAPQLGVEDEWVWPVIPYVGGHPAAWLVGVCAAAAYLVFVRSGSRRLQRIERSARGGRLREVERAGWLVALVAACLGWWFALLNAAPDTLPVAAGPEGVSAVRVPFGLGRSPLVLYYGRMSGYYFEARYTDQSAAEFLANYETSIASREDAQRYLHLGTHPPGMILLHRGVIACVERSPALRAALLRTLPATLVESNAAIRQEARAGGRDFTELDEAALWLATLLTFAACAATVVPLALLMRSDSLDFSAAWRWASLWAFVPAVCVFLPKCDALLPLPCVLAGQLLFPALHRSAPIRALAAGVVCCLGMLLSLAFIPVLLWLGGATLLTWWTTRGAAESSSPPEAPRPRLRPCELALVMVAIGCLLPIGILYFAARHNLVHTWLLNFRHHAEFYEHNSRSYGAWLVANVVEAAVAAGPPLLLLGAWGGVASLRNLWRRGASTGIAGAAGVIVLTLLLLSGKNMGEAARLWIPFFPWLILAAAARSPGTGQNRGTLGFAPTSGGPRFDSVWLLAAVLQAAIAILASTRIDGFGFSELPL